MGVVLPPNEVFLNQQLPLQDNQGGYHHQNWQQTVCKKGEGILAYYEDHPFPMKGHPYPEACEANNIVKKLTIGSLMSLAAPEAIPSFFGFALLPYKRKIKWLNKILTNYCIMADYALRSHYLKREYYNTTSKELWKFISHFLRNLGISLELSEKCGKIMATLLEYDDAYRLRVADIFTETNQAEMLYNPRKELLKVMEIYAKREKAGITEKLISVSKVLSYLLWLPRIRNAFTSAFRSTDIENLRLDEGDKYYALKRGDYDFMGKEEEQRKQEFISLYNRYAVERFKKMVKQSVTDPNAKLQLIEQIQSMGF